MIISIESAGIKINIAENKKEPLTYLLEKIGLKHKEIDIYPIIAEADDKNKVKLHKPKELFDTDIDFDMSELITAFKNFFEEEKIHDANLKTPENIKDMVLYYLKSPEDDLCLIYDDKDSSLIGVIILKRKPYPKEPDDAIRIRMLYVCKKYRRQGYASKLLQYAENEAIKLKKKKLRLRVYSKNIPAYECYKKFGFKEVNRI